MHLLVVCCLLAAVSAAPPVQEWIQIANAVQPLDDYVPTDLSPYDVTFDQFQEKYGKQYSSSLERSRRFDIFQANLRKIEEHNILYMSGGKSYYLGINRFTDLDQAEYSHFLGLNVNLKQNGSVGSTFLRPSNVMLPDFVDWREHGYVTGVKDQENCGSCWAFSATGSLEGQHFKKTGTLVSLSEQQLVDCSTAYGNEGCNGGLMDNAFRYVKKYGIESEVSYTYTAEDGDCKYIASKVVAHCSGLVDIQTESEKQLKEAVATVGPISVAIDASRASFHLYKAGIYDEPLCSSSKLDHGVLVVGYGTQTGQDYWIVKNSWGDIWGDNGYLKMSRNKDNQCGIATVASYPLV